MVNQEILVNTSKLSEAVQNANLKNLKCQMKILLLITLLI